MNYPFRIIHITIEKQIIEYEKSRNKIKRSFRRG